MPRCWRPGRAGESAAWGATRRPWHGRRRRGVDTLTGARGGGRSAPRRSRWSCLRSSLLLPLFLLLPHLLLRLLLSLPLLPPLATRLSDATRRCPGRSAPFGTTRCPPSTRCGSYSWQVLRAAASLEGRCAKVFFFCIYDGKGIMIIVIDVIIIIILCWYFRWC